MIEPAAAGGSGNNEVGHTGFLVVNADDWGRELRTTQMTLECIMRGSVSSVSAMVFMEDSERAAAIARERGIEAGLHLNFTTPFSASGCKRELMDRQQELSRYLRRHRLAQSIFHPGLVRSFEYVVAAQLDEFRRIYGADPDRLDGHHHMHLCANVLLQNLLPPGTLVRRSFSFQPGEKGAWNLIYRGLINRVLARRHKLVDFLFSLQPLDRPNRLQRICSLARRFVVEMETHPAQPEEYRFLESGQVFRWIGATRIAPASLALKDRACGERGGR